uniref:TonB-dependent receptor n=1 Tax=Roseovarius indicus TaxID=540747 RepID=UPI003B51A0B8
MARRPLFAVLLGGTALISATSALAQDGLGYDLGTLVLYGERSTDDPGRSNASVAVAEAEELDSPTIESWEDSFRRMANVNRGDFNESGFVIRGINSEGLTPGGLGAPLASFYIDGVQQTVEGTRRGFRGTFDVEQVEVYRGPQSTLQGRSALAGAIYLRTVDPTFEKSMKVQLTYGEDNRRQVGIAYGNKLSDNLAFRVSGEWSSKDTDLNYPSYQRFVRWDDYKTDDYYNVRGKLLWLPTGEDTTKVLLSYSHSFESPTDDNIAGINWSSTSPGYGAERGDVWGTIRPDVVAGIPLPPAFTEFPVFQDVRETTVDNFGVEITHEFSNALTLTAMTGWSRSVTDRHSINEGTPGEFMVTDGEFEQEILSQEIRLNFDNGPLRWVAGAYFSQEEQEAFRNQTILSFDASRNSASITNIAGFGEVSYEFAPGWRGIVGARVDYIDQEQRAFFASNGVVTTNTVNSFDDTVVLPKVGIEYSFSDTQRFALTYQEGYRPGGSGIQSNNGALFTYDAERAKNYELSWRGQFLQDSLTVGANLFFQDWDNQQVEVYATAGDPTSAFVANAGRSESYGAEIEIAYEPTARLEVYGSVGLLETEFKNFTVGGINYSGLPFPGAPESNVAVGFRWGAETGWFANGNVNYMGRSMSRIEQGVARPLTMDDYTTVDVSFGYGFDSGARVTAYATNLLDEEYFLYESSPGGLATLGDRREIGLRLDYTF